MVFSPAQSQSPVYTRSRASFLTGRYPRTIRCRQNGQDIPADEVLATKLQADAGQLFDLAADSGETRNLWNEAAARTAKAELNPSQRSVGVKDRPLFAAPRELVTALCTPSSNAQAATKIEMVAARSLYTMRFFPRYVCPGESIGRRRYHGGHSPLRRWPIQRQFAA